MANIYTLAPRGGKKSWDHIDPHQEDRKLVIFLIVCLILFPLFFFILWWIKHHI